MNKFFIVLFHTYLSKLKTKSFIVSTIIMVLLVIGLASLPKVIDYFDKDEKVTIGVLDKTGSTYETLNGRINTINRNVKLKTIENEAAAKKLINSEKLTGYLIIEKDSGKSLKGTYKAKIISDSSISDDLLLALTQVKSSLAAGELKLSPEQLAQLSTPAAFEKVALEKNAKTEDELNQARGLVYILLFVIYLNVIMYASMIAMEIATEKTSRVMEILVSSVSPVQQMFAKICGIALLSITQILLFLSAGYVSIKPNLDEMNGGIFSFLGFDGISISTIIYAIIFCLLGYFLYATLAAFLGSLVSRVEDVQQMILPVTMLIMIAFFIAMYGLTNPTAGFITGISFIPFFSPMIMFLRVGMISVPFWEVALSIGLLVVTIVLLGIFGGKVYRGGVLMYGSSKSYKDIKKALQISKNG
ncbi:ABC transporter permease [Peribacillus cavernae]|uniref:ABC transporter permease n=1 Tax=Peribacillus cavernae TaxID=1674310 RepID=A0A3S0U395_9BACI|nr:ABC transporter permease [Peribacillus cavernae]MDQ0217620.1 ABC-2 type transport system permease protein [Peribacillus cavernae]RUQ29951.1 ABC transporter permease [Peribacillus cavernae]